MSEAAGRTADQASGAELVSYLFGLGRALTLYEVNNAAIVRLVDGVAATLEQHRARGGGTLELQLLAEEFFVNGSLLVVDPRLYERATELARGLVRFGIGSLSFGPECTRAVLEKLTSDWAASLRAGKSLFVTDGYAGITLAPAEGLSIASFHFDPDRLALWLYASLLDLTDEVYADHAASQKPSLLQVRRLLQLAIDGLGRHSGVYELLAAARDPSRAPTRERLRVAVAIEAVGFGHFLGFSKRRLMTLGLGGVLGALADSADPDQAVEPLLEFPGLGDAAPALVVAVHDARRIRAGGAGGHTGHVLALAERYVELTTGVGPGAGPGAGEPAPHPRVVIECLVRDASEHAPAADESPAGRELAERFAIHKGPYPVGSPVLLSDGSLAVVLARTTHGDSPEQPVVARWTGAGELGEPIDLAERPDLAITATPIPAQAGVDLTSIRARPAPADDDAAAG